ncbi:unnamed protein product, partial [Ectocarpus sp. 4 AP-2014]
MVRQKFNTYVIVCLSYLVNRLLHDTTLSLNIFYRCTSWSSSGCYRPQPRHTERCTDSSSGLATWHNNAQWKFHPHALTLDTEGWQRRALNLRVPSVRGMQSCL